MDLQETCLQPACYGELHGDDMSFSAIWQQYARTSAQHALFGVLCTSLVACLITITFQLFPRCVKQWCIAGAAPECSLAYSTWYVCKHFRNFHFLGNENQQLAIELAARVLPQLLRLCQNLGRKGSVYERTHPAAIAHLHSCSPTVLTSAAPAATVLVASVTI